MPSRAYQYFRVLHSTNLLACLIVGLLVFKRQRSGIGYRRTGCRSLRGRQGFINHLHYLPFRTRRGAGFHSVIRMQLGLRTGLGRTLQARDRTGARIPILTRRGDDVNLAGSFGLNLLRPADQLKWGWQVARCAPVSNGRGKLFSRNGAHLGAGCL